MGEQGRDKPTSIKARRCLVSTADEVSESSAVDRSHGGKKKKQFLAQHSQGLACLGPFSLFSSCLLPLLSSSLSVDVYNTKTVLAFLPGQFARKVSKTPPGSLLAGLEDSGQINFLSNLCISSALPQHTWK